MTSQRMTLAAWVAAASLIATGCGALSSGTSSFADDADAGDVAATVPVSTDSGFDTHDSDDHYVFDGADLVEIALADPIPEGDESVSVDGTTVTITGAGAYRLSGTLNDGQVVVDAGDDAVVQLVLDGASITNSDGAAIAVMSADTAVVILADGSQNALTDGATYVLPEGEDEPNATLFSKSDLTITGNGELTVVGNSNDGIASKDGLIIDSGTISVRAIDDGIRGRDYLLVSGGTINVSAGDDGLKSDNDEDADRGRVVLAAGVVTVTAGDDGINATLDVTIDGGDLTLSTGDDGIHGDSFVTINGGSVEITDSFEGIESEVITINDGVIDVTSTDDGLNVADGGDTTTTTTAGPGGRGGGGVESIGDYFVHINGGTISITIDPALNEQGDGIDSNGNIVMTGGVVTVSGPTDTRNSAVDTNGTFEVSGGLFIGTNIDGRNSEGADSGSTQASVYLTSQSVLEAGTVVHIQTTDGRTLATFQPANEFSVIVFTSPDLIAGETYEVYLGGSVTGDSATGLYDDDAYELGTLAGTVTAA